MERIEVTITTDADGNGTGYAEPTQSGFLQAFRYVKPGSGGYDNGVQAVVTGETSGMAILTWAAMNASGTRAPRQPTHAVADGAASLYAAGGTAVNDRIPIARERVKVVISSGGATKTGTFHVWVG